jgi:inner membrane protein
MTLAAEAPDLDVLWDFRGPVLGFAHHRGFTHSFLGLLLVAAAVTGFMYLVWLLRGRKTNVLGLAPRWNLLFAFAYLAGLSHLLLDFTNNYGLRPLWPFSERWYSWDIVFIVEPALYLFLLGGLFLPILINRKDAVRGGRAAPRLALVFMVALYLARDFEHRKAVGWLRGASFQSARPIRVSAYPYYWNIFRWYAVAETRDLFATTDMDSRTGQLERSELAIYRKSPETPAIQAAKRSYIGRVYLDWARYPWITETRDGADSIVRFEDLRFKYPEFRTRITLSASVELNDTLRVVKESFGRRPQQPPLD